MGELLSQRAEKLSEQPYLQIDDRHWSYAEVNNEAIKFASGLQERGVGPGDRVAVLLPNIPEFVIALFGCAKAGVILVPINFRRNQSEVITRLSKTRPKVFILSTDWIQKNVKSRGDLEPNWMEGAPQLEVLVSVGEEKADGIPWNEFVSTTPDSSNPKIDIRDPAIIVHTLGSTGEPRGAVLTHEGVVRNAAQIAANIGANTEDVFLGAVPFSNTFGITATILTCVVAGGRIVCMPKYHPAQVQELIANEGITIHSGVPTMYAMELNHPGFKKKAFTSLRTGFMAGAPCPASLVTRARKEMGCNILIGYGLTEASPSVTMTHLDDGPVTSTETVGIPMDDVEIKVVGPDNKELPFGETGELCVRGYNVMLGYWEDPQATSDVLDEEGWLHTGDLAIIDPDGPVRIVGRLHELIIRSGFTIHPGVIEMALRTHPDVKDAAAVGIPDLIYGELIAACVVQHAGAKLTKEALSEFSAMKLPEYAQPDRIYFFDALPRRGSGPVQKDYLRTQVRIRGHAWKFGKNVDTDAIIPARRCNTADPKELAQFCMEDADPDFVHKMQRGDLIVAEANFGCGSSREVAPLTLKAAGVSAVIAESFARIFFRNAVNIGLPILECPEAVAGIQETDEVEVEPASGIIRNLTRGKTYQAQPFPDFLQHIIDAGGLLAYVENRLIASEEENLQ
jgi:fatty-acyl-CoA synthase